MKKEGKFKIGDWVLIIDGELKKISRNETECLVELMNSGSFGYITQVGEEDKVYQISNIKYQMFNRVIEKHDTKVIDVSQIFWTYINGYSWPIRLIVDVDFPQNRINPQFKGKSICFPFVCVNLCWFDWNEKF